MQNNLHRWYDATVGVRISEDPIGFAGGDANLARYVGNMPTIYVDPQGLLHTDEGLPDFWEMVDLSHLEKRTATFLSEYLWGIEADSDEQVFYSRHRLSYLLACILNHYLKNYGRLDWSGI